MSCFDNEYKLNREDEDFPKGEAAMATLYYDNGLDDDFEDFDDEEIVDGDFEDYEEDEEFENSELEHYRGLD